MKRGVSLRGGLQRRGVTNDIMYGAIKHLEAPLGLRRFATGDEQLFAVGVLV